jgi:hypothetical protein
MSKLFPEADERFAERVLRSGRELRKEETPQEALEKVRQLNVVTIREREYVQCAHESDPDFSDAPDLDCRGEAKVDPEEPDRLLECNECGRTIERVRKKKHFHRYRFDRDDSGILEYVTRALDTLDPVSHVEPAESGADVRLENGNELEVVVPKKAGAQQLYKGLFFAEPTLYIHSSPLDNPALNVLEERQHIHLTDFLSKPAHEIAAQVQEASVPIEGRRAFDRLEDTFDVLVDKGWQHFEGNFVPALVNLISERPEAGCRYLDRLRRLRGTIFGKYYVPVGGGGEPDLRYVDKFSMMNQLFAGDFIGDAKCYKKSSFQSEDIETISRHILEESTNITGSVVFLSTNDVISTAWLSVQQMREEDEWKFIILTKYLLLELVDALGAHDLLEV